MKNSEKFELSDRLKRTTTKKTKVVGTKKYINADTGEAEEMLVTEIKDADCNFTKVFLYALLPQLEVIGNKKIVVCNWIIEHLSRDNTLIATIEDISKGTGVSVRTVQETVQKLIECDFLKRKVKGAYMVNPEVMFKGSSSARVNVLFQYSAIDSDVPSSTVKQLQVKEIEKSVGQLSKKARRLNQEIETMNIEDEVYKARKAGFEKRLKKEEQPVFEDEFDSPEDLSFALEENG